MLHSVHEWQMYQYKNSFSFEKKTPQLCNCFIYIFFASYFTTCIWNLQLHVHAWYILMVSL